MGKRHTMTAGGTATQYNVNMNGNQGGGNKKQGLVRTINVEVSLNEGGNLSSENKKRLGHSLELQLESKSVHNTPY